MWAFLYACVTPHVIPSEARDLQSAMFDSEITAACPRDTVRSISVQYACSFGNIFRSREQVAGRRALEDELSTLMQHNRRRLIKPSSLRVFTCTELAIARIYITHGHSIGT